MPVMMHLIRPGVLARRWPCRLTNEWVGDGFRIHTEEEIIEADRQGKQLE